MRVIWRCVFVTDVAVLVGLNHAIVFVIEWLGVTRARIEQTLIMLYVVCAIGDTQLGGYRWIGLSLELVVVVFFWMRHRSPAAIRAMLLLDRESAALRVFVLFFFSVVALSFALTLPRRGFTVGLDVLYPLLTYVLALPGGGDPGRRRKLALAKLKEMFGTSWMPAPESAS